MPLVTHVPRRSVLRRSRYVRTLPCESAPRARRNTKALVPKRFAELPGRTVAGRCTESSSDVTPAVRFIGRSFWETVAARVWGAAGGRVVGVAWSKRRLNTRLNAGAIPAASPEGAATALSVAGAGAAIRSARSALAVIAEEPGAAFTVPGAGAVTRYTRSSALAVLALAATALLVLPTLLVEGLTLIVGSSYPTE